MSEATTFVDETPTPSAFGLPSSTKLPTATVLFDFGASSPFEVTVSEGDTVNVLEPDDGSGWVKVSNPNGSSGLVPATYIQLDDPNGSANESTFATKSTPGSGRFVKGIYAYTAQGDDEIDVVLGAKIELTDVGESYADGWWEGISPKGKKGIFPSNYVELV
ncbi:hypothetical protein FRC03_004154 [Tulasnella sp. 419]|nr:hypothetical protein FRC03_004154 [Tulasnella sp. 419]